MDQRKAARVLPGAGGGDNEGVAALADALPCAFLCSGGCAKGAAEPLADGGGEGGECIGHVSIMTRVTGHLIYGVVRGDDGLTGNMQAP